MKFRLLFSSVFAILFVYSAPGSAMLIDFELENNRVSSISGIQVGDTLYSVSFENNDNCRITFNGCDNPEEDFAFQTPETSRAASEALWLAIDDIYNSSDLDFGCFGVGDFLYDGFCKIVTPYGLGPEVELGQTLSQASLYLIRAYNSMDVEYGGVTTDGWWFVEQTPFPDNSYQKPWVYAKWAPVVSAVNVNEPSIYSLFALGLGVLFFVRKRSKNTR